jgi:hypothetical protein
MNPKPVAIATTEAATKALSVECRARKEAFLGTGFMFNYLLKRLEK